MSEKVKILYFVDRMLRGGIQTFVLENIKHMNREEVQVDFLLLDDGKEYELEDDLKKLNCQVYKLKDIWIRKISDFIKYDKALDDFFKEHHNYKVIHLHSSSKNYRVLKKAKKYGIPIRIAHSHCIDFQTKNPIKKIVGSIFKIPLKRYATDFFACSKQAGKWLFGKKIIISNTFKVIYNAVDLEKFRFDENSRKKIRNLLKIDEDTLVIGHVGRFTEQKNHEFLIDIFNEIKKKNLKAKLLLIGEGMEQDKIRNKVKKLNLEDSVIMEGYRTNVNEYMFAMDVFVFPSKFEGLGLVLIEAQAAGLPCYTSKNVVPLEAKVSSLLDYISLEELPLKWAQKILSSNNKRVNEYKKIKESGYDINDTADFLEKFYKSREIKE